MIHKKIHCAIYQSPVLFYTDCTGEDFIKHLEENYKIEYEEPEEVNGCKGITFQEDCKDESKQKTHYIIWVRDKRDFSTLVHECLHLAYAFLDDRQIPITRDNEETVAYYLAHWVELFRKEISRRKTKKEK